MRVAGIQWGATVQYVIDRLSSPDSSPELTLDRLYCIDVQLVCVAAFFAFSEDSLTLNLLVVLAA